MYKYILELTLFSRQYGTAFEYQNIFIQKISMGYLRDMDSSCTSIMDAEEEDNAMMNLYNPGSGFIIEGLFSTIP